MRSQCKTECAVIGRMELFGGKTARRGADAVRAPVPDAVGAAHPPGVVGGSAAVPELRWPDGYPQLHHRSTSCGQDSSSPEMAAG